jgi:hypothetical protein
MHAWFVAALNGPAARTMSIDPSFLGTGTYKATIVRDNLDNDAAVIVESKDVRAGPPLQIAMRRFSQTPLVRSTSGIP